MESNKLTILTNPLPLKAYPDQEKLNSLIITGLVPFISGLLSLTDETSAKRLEMALPAIKEHCWSMGFAEIKKMFEMYADGKLSIQPMPNYFDRILFGKIVQSYKDIKPVKKQVVQEKEMSQQEKDKIVFLGAVNCFDSFVQDGYIINGYVWVYDHLDGLKLLNYTPQEKRDVMPVARERLIEDEKTSRTSYQQFMKDLENGRKQQAIINKAKVMLLERYFAKLHTKKEHIKDYL